MGTKAGLNRWALAPRGSLLVAGLLVVVGFLRFLTDTLHEIDARYWTALEGTPLRYLVRAPSDGTVVGYLNAQWFKVLAIPSGICLIYLRHRFDAGSPLSNEDEFHDWAIRGVWIVVFFVGFTAIELQKQFAFFAMRTHRVEGEDPLVNHLAHLIGAVASWKLAGALTIADKEERHDL